MLAGDNDGIGQFAVEGVGVTRVNGGAERVRVGDGRVSDVGLVCVDELDDGVKVLRVVGAVLRFGEVEGAGACGVGWRWWCQG